jgi:outer membrane lipoprotein SlyB
MKDFRKIHPLVLRAAAAAIVVSLAAAAISGFLPSAHSQTSMDQAQVPPQTYAAATEAMNHGVLRLVAQDGTCASCGTVVSSRAVEVNGDGTGLGVVAGGVTGAVIGNQMGKVNGNAAMTVLGAPGGAFAGNEIESGTKKHFSHRITLRMDDGSYRTVSQFAAPRVAAGERVRIADGAVIAGSMRLTNIE